MLTISIKLAANKVKRYPKLKIFVDGDLIEDVQLLDNSQTISFPIALEDGEHYLEIEHYGKTSEDTIATEDGRIIEDTYFRIEGINIDEYELPILILWTSVLIPDWTGLKKPYGFPNKLSQVLEVGTNGIWKMPFYTPVTDWLIHRRKASSSKLKDTTVFESYEPSTHSTLDYKLTKEDKAVISEIKKMINE